MKVTEVKRKESTKHCCGNGCLWRDSAEHEEETEALIDKRIAQNNAADADRQASGLLEEIVSRGNLNRAYKRVKKNRGAGGVDWMNFCNISKTTARKSDNPFWLENTSRSPSEG